MNPPKSLGNFLKSERQRLGLTQAALGQVCGVDRRTQYKYENGTSQPSMDYLRGLQSAGVDVSLVLFGNRTACLTQMVEWSLLWQAIEDVEIFVARYAATCPSGVKHEMVERLYAACIENRSNDRSAPVQREARQRLLAATLSGLTGNEVEVKQDGGGERDP